MRHSLSIIGRVLMLAAALAMTSIAPATAGERRADGASAGIRAEGGHSFRRHRGDKGRVIKKRGRHDAKRSHRAERGDRHHRRDGRLSRRHDRGHDWGRRDWRGKKLYRHGKTDPRRWRRVYRGEVPAIRLPGDGLDGRRDRRRPDRRATGNHYSPSPQVIIEINPWLE